MQGILPIPMLEADIQRISNQLQHLERSIEELKEAFKTDSDPVYKNSIQENIVLVAKQRARLATLQEMHKTALCAVPTSEDPQPCQQQTLEHHYHRQPLEQQSAQGMDVDEALASRGELEARISQGAARDSSPDAQGTVEDGIWL